MKPKKKRGGYTLIETLIVIAIMAILASMLLAYNNSSTNNVALYADQATIAGVLGRAKSLALEKWNGNGSGGAACAFGVHFTASGSYFVYEDVPTGTPPNCDGAHNHAYTGGDIVIQNLALSGGIGFVSAAQDVWFVPPYLTSVNALITIQTKGSAYGVGTSSVQVTSGGAVTSL